MKLILNTIIPALLVIFLSTKYFAEVKFSGYQEFISGTPFELIDINSKTSPANKKVLPFSKF